MNVVGHPAYPYLIIVVMLMITVISFMSNPHRILKDSDISKLDECVKNLALQEQESVTWFKVDTWIKECDQKVTK